jgi:hypothetical protein
VLSKARRGELVQPLPVGLVYNPVGKVVLDPDASVAGPVARVFTTFTATGSALAVVKAFTADSLLFPRRLTSARATWSGASCSTPVSCRCCTTRVTPARSSTAAAPITAALTAR